MRARVFLLASWALLAVCGPGVAWAQDVAVSEGVVGERAEGQGGAQVDGRVTLQDAYSLDNQTQFDVHLLFGYADLRAKNLAEIGGASLHFNLDSRLLLDLTGDETIATSEYSNVAVRRNERRFGETQTYADVNQLHLELEGLGPMDLKVGRSWVYESGGAWVDGAHLAFHLSERWEAGFFGGLQPDPFNYLLTTDRQTSGTFVQYTGERTQASLGYTMQLVDLTLDRHFLFSRAHWSVPVGDWGRSLFLSYYASLDLQNEDPTFTTAFTNASWWVTDALNFGASYARFATSRIRDTSEQRFQPDPQQRDVLGDQINTGPYQQLRLSATQRFGHYNVYQQIDLRNRDVLDERSAVYYRAGLRDNGFLGTDLELHGRLTVRNNFLSDTTEFLLEGSYLFGSVFDLNLMGQYQLGRSLIVDQAQDVLIANARGTVNLSDNLYLSFDYELALETNIQQEEEATSGGLTTHTFFTNATWRF
jgi:hypothetical protein